MLCGSLLASQTSRVGDRGLSPRLGAPWKRRLIAALGQRVIRVPAAMTGQARKVSRRAGKSDRIDARAVALAVVRDGIGSFPQAFCDEHAGGDPRALRLSRSDHL